MNDIAVRLLAEADLAEAARINRIAFGTFFGLDDPSKFRGDGDSVHGRFHANPDGAFAADLDGRLVASGFVMDWGSVGILGPLTVDVDCWSRGIARAMMAEMVGWMDRRGFALHGLFTHPQSATHIRLYEDYGYGMQRITGIMAKEVGSGAAMPADVRLFSELSIGEKDAALADCRAVADTVFPGLDLSREIGIINQRALGDTLLLGGAGELSAFACCHQGAMTEAGSAQALVKFAVVRDAPGRAAVFADLLAACEGFAVIRGVTRLIAGTNTGRAECYRAMIDAGFRTWMNGIAMLRPEGNGYNRAGVFAIDDWR